MTLLKQNVLIFTRTMYLGGTENVILQICERIRPKVNKIIVCSCGGVNVEKLKQLGIQHYTIPDIEHKDLKTAVKVCLSLWKIVEKEKITLIHTHHRMAAFYVTLLGLYKKRAFLCTCHNTFYNKKKLTQYAYKNATLIACGSEVKKNLIEEFNIPEDHITTIHNAVKPFEQNEVVEIDLLKQLREKQKFIVGNVGRLTEQKGMTYFIEAAAILEKKYQDIVFLIVGSGELEEKLKQQVEALDIRSSVLFLGYRNDIQNTISQVDLLVLSSLWEGFPLTPIEAFSVGKTVVATAVDGTKEIVIDKQNGLLVDPKNAKQIAEAIEYLYLHPNIRLRLEESAKCAYDERFSYDEFGNQYINAYCKLVNRE